MGPRFFKRGNGQLKSKLSEFIPRFNGAALFQARKSINIYFNHTSTISFNGAALFQARKFISQLQFFILHLLLQWGRAFSSAEIHWKIC